MGLKKDDLVVMFEKNSRGFSDKFKKSILLPTGRGGVYAARDFIHANAVLAAIAKWGNPGVENSAFQSRDDLKTNLPAAVNFRLNAYTPCLAARFDELKKPQQEAIFNLPTYMFTEKENGCRGWLIFSKGKVYLFSRNYSDVDCSLLEYSSNIKIDHTIPADVTFAVDVEIKFEPKSDLMAELLTYGITTESKLEAMSALLQTRSETAMKIQEKYKASCGGDLITFRMISPLFFKGKNYLKRTLSEGHNDYDEVCKYAQEHGVNVQPLLRCVGTKEKKTAFLQSILDDGGEGVVVHNLKAYYNTSENRDKDTFIKIKRSVAKDSAQKGLGDTIEGYITGFKMSNEDSGDAGLIGSFEITIMMKTTAGPCVEHIIAYIPNIPKDMKIAATAADADGNPTLAEEFYGVVVEVDGQAISAKSRRLTHPRMTRFRYDKSKHECIYTEEFIKSQMV